MNQAKPEPLTCPACGSPKDWVWDDEDVEWVLDSDWWDDPVERKAGEGFTCSHICYLKRLKSINCDLGPSI